MKAHDTQARVRGINGWRHRIIPHRLMFVAGLLIAELVRAISLISPDADFKRRGVMAGVWCVFACQIVSGDPYGFSSQGISVQVVNSPWAFPSLMGSDIGRRRGLLGDLHAPCCRYRFTSQS